jgi:hypothetical protein
VAPRGCGCARPPPRRFHLYDGRDPQHIPRVLPGVLRDPRTAEGGGADRGGGAVQPCKPRDRHAGAVLPGIPAAGWLPQRATRSTVRSQVRPPHAQVRRDVNSQRGFGTTISGWWPPQSSIRKNQLRGFGPSQNETTCLPPPRISQTFKPDLGNTWWRGRLGCWTVTRTRLRRESHHLQPGRARLAYAWPKGHLGRRAGQES